jgi:hypothetical protein
VVAHSAKQRPGWPGAPNARGRAQFWAAMGTEKGKAHSDPMASATPTVTVQGKACWAVLLQDRVCVLGYGTRES